jgi:cell division protein FtsB
MPGPEQIEWSPEEERLLRQEAFYTEILRRRTLPTETHKEPVWRQILDSKLLLTLVSIVLGGIVGKLIVSSYQDRAKQAALEVAEYRQFISRQQDVVQKTYDLLGEAVSDSQVLLSLTQPVFEEKNIQPADRVDVHKQKKTLLEQHQKLSLKWDAEKYKTGLLLEYYHFNHPAVVSHWASSRDSVEKLLQCSVHTYGTFLNGGGSAKPDSCLDEKTKVQADLDGLAEAVGQAREYTWQHYRASPTKTNADTKP